MEGGDFLRKERTHGAFGDSFGDDRSEHGGNARRRVRRIGSNALVHDVRREIHFDQGRSDKTDLVPTRIVEIDADEMRGDIEQQRDLFRSADAQFVQMARRVDGMGDLHHDLLPPLLGFLFRNVLQKDRQSILGRVDAEIVPRLEPVILIRSLDALERPGRHRNPVLLPQLRLLRIREHLEHILAKHFQ